MFHPPRLQGKRVMLLLILNYDPFIQMWVTKRKVHVSWNYGEGNSSCVHVYQKNLTLDNGYYEVVGTIYNKRVSNFHVPKNTGSGEGSFNKIGKKAWGS